MYEIINQVTKISTDMEPATSLLKDVLTWGDKKFTERRNKVIEKFYIQLLDGEVTPERISYEKEHIEANSEQYYILLNLAINDEEQDKDFIYSNVYRYIRDNQHLDKKEKIKLIKIIKQLSYSTLELLPYIYIHLNYHTKEKLLIELLKELESTHEYELNLLFQLNIFHKPKQHINTNNIFDIKDDEYFNNLCIAFFTKEKLIPSIYNIEIYSNKKVLIIINDESNTSFMGEQIKTKLRNFGIKSEIIHYKNATIKDFTHAFFFLDYEKINSNFNDLIEELGFKQNIKCIKVLLLKPKYNLDSNTTYLDDKLQGFKELLSE